jgi:hypothetical protein
MTRLRSHEYFITAWVEIISLYPKRPISELLEWTDRSIRAWMGCKVAVIKARDADSKKLSSLCSRFVSVHKRQHRLYNELMILEFRDDPMGSKERRKTTRRMNTLIDKHHPMMQELEWLGLEVLAVTGG